MADDRGRLVNIGEPQGVGSPIQLEREVTESLHVSKAQSLVHQLQVGLSLPLTTLEKLLTPPHVRLW